MKLEDLKYRIEDDINSGSLIEIIGFKEGSERLHRYEDESEVSRQAYFILKIENGKPRFRIREKPFTHTILLSGSGTDYGWYLDWGSKLHREIFKYLFTGEGNKVRKNKLYNGAF